MALLHVARGPRSTWSPSWRTCRCRRRPTGSPSCAEHGLPVGGVVVNLTRPQELDDEARDLARSAGDAAPRGVAADLPQGRRRRAARQLLDGLLDEARDHAERRGLEDEQRERIAALDVPTYELTRLADGIDLGGLYELAADLRRQGMA